MHNVRIFKIICAITALFVVALLAAYCAADDWQWQLALAEAEAAQQTAGMTPQADPAPGATVNSEGQVARVITVPRAPVVIKAAKPIGPHWTHPMADTKPELIAHLLSDGVHRGRHTRQQLEAMTYSELERIHDSDHNASRKSAAAYCPNCNNPRRGLFGRR